MKYGVSDAAALMAVEIAANGTSLGRVEQVNRVFDTASFDLNRSKYLLRLRDEDGAFSLTAKGPETTDLVGLLVRRDELELAIDAVLVAALVAGTVSPLDALDVGAGDGGRLIKAMRGHIGQAPLGVVGWFANTRERRAATIDAQGQSLEVVLELDTTTYSNRMVRPRSGSGDPRGPRCRGRQGGPRRPLPPGRGDAVGHYEQVGAPIRGARLKLPYATRATALVALMRIQIVENYLARRRRY